MSPKNITPLLSYMLLTCQFSLVPDISVFAPRVTSNPLFCPRESALGTFWSLSRVVSECRLLSIFWDTLTLVGRDIPTCTCTRSYHDGCVRAAYVRSVRESKLSRFGSSLLG